MKYSGNNASQLKETALFASHSRRVEPKQVEEIVKNLANLQRFRRLEDREIAQGRIIQREAGLGSLGQQRFVAIAHCDGGYVASEAKRVVPSASLWLEGQISCRQSYYQKAMTSAVRSEDPYQKIRVLALAAAFAGL